MGGKESHVGKITVLSTIAMIDDLVGQIGRERIEHLSLIKGEIDPHSYELIKGDEEKFSSAAVVFYNGLNLEHGASLQYQLQKHPQSIALGNLIKDKHPEMILFKNGQMDPHIWMDILIWVEAIDPIVSSLSSIDPDGSDYFKSNGEQLRQKMLHSHQLISEKLSAIPDDKRFLVTSHDAFHYFSRRYLGPDISRCTAPEGLAPDGQLSSRDIQRIVDYLTDRNVGVVFSESNVSHDSLRKIISVCLHKGLKVRLSDQILYADALGAPGSGAASYLAMMEHNAEVLVHEWQ